MFIFNVGGKDWARASEVDELRGAVFLASCHPNSRFTRKPGPELSRVLLDPQLYLATLDGVSCAKTCARLATHPWFCVPGVPEYDSGLSGTREWQKGVAEIAAKAWPTRPPSGNREIGVACYAAIGCQLQFGCTHVILPAPMVEEREDEGATVGEWLDCGIASAEELGVDQPVLATVAISDATLNDDAFQDGGFLDALVDQVTAREGHSGVYIVIAQSGGQAHPFQSSRRVLRAYLHLSASFHRAGVADIVVNFADVFGLVCAAVGATGYATGASQRQRRLVFSAFKDEGFGVALPYYYSHRVAGEFATQQDLDKVIKHKLIRRIADETRYSEELLTAIASGRNAGDLLAWAEGRNNTTAAQLHFITRLAMEGASLRSKTLPKRYEVIRDWLENSAAGADYLRKRIGGPVGRLAPTEVWLSLLEELEESRS